MALRPEPVSNGVDRPVMRQRWEHLTFLHWPLEPAMVQARLPGPLRVDVFDGRAWVGLVPFRMVGIGPPRGPAIPYFGTFWETNVRTYVVGPDGERGVWFDSLDVDRALPVLVARAAFGLPYMWARMSGTAKEGRVSYRIRRRWPHGSRPVSDLVVGIGDRIPDSDLSELDAFLTRRWRLFARRGTRVIRAEVGHEAWPLHRAHVDQLEDGLVEAAGYQVEGPPVSALYSPGVAVTAERPRVIARDSS
jgi:uncharacterized protein YqjF (DUF2071 family)